jgi:hypothetical protein
MSKNMQYLCERHPDGTCRVRSRHRTQHAAFQSVRGRRFDRMRKAGISFFVPLLRDGETVEQWLAMNGDATTP